jgi:Na+/H+ antiporter NhaC
VTAFFVVVGLLVANAFLPNNPEDFGVLTVIPSAFLIIYIFATKRILEALTLATLMGLVMVHNEGFFSAYSASLLKVLMSEDMAWLFLVCGLMGSVIALVEKAGGSFAFSEWVSKKAKTQKKALFWTWILGMGIFIDDYLNCLTVGSCMTPITDRHKTPRELLAYVVDSTAAPVCVMIPISTWAVFVAKLLETNGLAPAGEGMWTFIKTIPFNFYGWFAAIIVPLVIWGVIPIFGPMKKAVKRAQETGVLAPPGSEKIDIKAGETMEIPEKPRLINFFVPMLFLVAATVYFDLDVMKGVIATMGFLFIFFVPQKIVDAEEFADLSVKGIKNMLLPCLIMALAFTFADANEQVGFTSYVIETATKVMTPALTPLVIFIVLAFTEFITGTSWGMYIIAYPIVIPLALAVGANPIIAVAAVMSAGVLGSHLCFYADATILTSAATGCNNFDHALTQMPYGLLAASLSVVAYLAAGFLL